MQTKSKLALGVLFIFSVLSVYAVLEVGYWGIIMHLLDGPAAWQIAADLVIALSMVLLWLTQDAKKNGRRILPWVILTLLLGSIGPLLYIVLGVKPTSPKTKTQH
ncbi:MAG: hypothetical protein GW763_11960 [Paraglaciecola sp.]|nr:hypothetical protein [Paraglaciecola sp.]NCT48679.1 hypothetical protein [Paraglaciecola sp.]